MKKTVLIIITVLISTLSFGFGNVDDFLKKGGVPDTLNVGLNIVEPFVVKLEHGYQGVTMDLFNQFLRDTHVVVNYTEYSTTGELIQAIKNGEQDMGVGPITITPERYKAVNFTQPYLGSSMSLAYDPDDAYDLWDLIYSYFTIDLFYGICYFILFLWVGGVGIMLLERGENKEFEDKGSMFLGVYFSFMVFSTIGFGDIVPKTTPGRIFTIIFGTVCMMVSSFFVANIASSSTLSKLESEMTVANLNQKKVGTLRECTSAEFLDNNNVRYIGFDSAEEGLKAIKTGELDVFVYDTPILQNLITNLNLSDNIVLSDEEYEPQFYGFPVNKCCHMDEMVNPIIVKHTTSNDWLNTLNNYHLDK